MSVDCEILLFLCLLLFWVYVCVCVLFSLKSLNSCGIGREKGGIDSLLHQQQQPKSSGDQASSFTAFPIRTKIAGNHPCDPKRFNLSSNLGLPCCLNEITVVMMMG